MTDKVQKIREVIEKRYEYWRKKEFNSHSTESEIRMSECKRLLFMVDSLQEEPVSEDNTLRKASEEYLKVLSKTPYNNTPITNAQTIVRELITFLDNPSKYNPNHIEEPVSDELEETAIEICSKVLKGETITIDGYEYVVLSDAEECFKAGAQWQKAKDESTTEDLGEYINELSKQFPEVSFAKLSRIAVRAAKWQKEQFEKDYTDLCNGIATAKGIAVAMAYDKGVADTKEQMMKNIWKPADGDDLPEYDREVVVFTQNFPDDAGIMSVAIGHRPNPDGWDGKSLSTGKVEHYTPKTYDKGGWNIPDIKFWLDVKLPKEIEL